MKKWFIDKFDFLWEGDRENLLIMWFSILLAILTIIQLIITIFYI